MASAEPHHAVFEADVSAVQTWRAPGLHVLDGLDLAGLITSGAVQGLIVQPDGSLVFQAPDGPPPGLEGLVEPVSDALEDRLSMIEESLAALRADREDREKMQDRLDAVEFGLNERLAGIVAEETFNLFAEQAEPGTISVAERVDEILAKVRDLSLEEGLSRLEAKLVDLPAPDLSALERVEARLAELPTPETLVARLEEIASRPLPPIDLTPQRQMNARFLQAVGEVIHRMDAAISGLPAAAEAGITAKLPELMAELTARVDERLGQIPDPAPLLAAVERQIADLAMRPSALPDLTPMRQMNARLLTAMAEGLGRLEAAVDALPMAAEAGIGARVAALAEGLPVLSVHLEDRLDAILTRTEALGSVAPDLSPIEAGLAALNDRLARLEAAVQPPDLSPMTQAAEAMTTRIEAALNGLAQRIDALERRPDPVLDLTEQRKSFAAFGTALSRSLQRIEGVADRWEAAPDPIAALIDRFDAMETARQGAARDDLAGAILALAQRVAEREPPRTGESDFDRFRAAQQDFFQDLRFLLAEMVASQLRQRVEHA